MVKTGVVAMVVALVGCGGRQSGGGGGESCSKVPAGKRINLERELVFTGGYASVQTANHIEDGEHVEDGQRRWGIRSSPGSEGHIRWVVETDTAIRIGYSKRTPCFPPEPGSAIAVRLPGTTKPIVAEQCRAKETCP